MSKKNYEHNNENVIEWLTNEKVVWITACEMKLKNRLKALYEKDPESFNHWNVNQDGSIYACIPRKWIKVSAPRVLDEGKRRELGERMKELTKIRTERQ